MQEAIANSWRPRSEIIHTHELNESPLSLCSGTEVHFTRRPAGVACGLSLSEDAGVTE